MKKRIKKVFVTVLAASTIMTSTYSAYASQITVNMPYEIYSSKNHEYLASGVRYENIKKFTALGWWNINVIRIDLENEYTELKGLFNKEGIPKRDTVSNMVSKHGAVAGINGDFFNYSPMPSPLGGLISEGKIIISPVEAAYALPSFYLTHDNEGEVGYLDRSIIVTELSSGLKVNVNTLNKVTASFETLTLLDRNWGTQTIGNRFHDDLVEVIVENNVIKDIRVGQDVTDIPENGYVIAGRGARAEVLKELRIGALVNLDLSTRPNIDRIKFAIGGGSIILKDGELALTNIISPGSHPRTGIGINKDKTEMILVTIDGRDSSFKGVSQEMFGAIMRDLGAYNAINLDGGGSTAMAVKPLGENKASVVNKPVDGVQRYVVNGVGVFSTAPKGELTYLKVTTDDNQMFVNTRRNITVRGFDENHNPVEIDPSLIKLSVKGVKGSFEDNKFKPSTPGIANIRVDYNNIEGNLELVVLDTVKDIDASKSDYSLETNSKFTLPTFTGKDSKGSEAKIYLEDINFEIVGDIGTIDNGVFHSGQSVRGGAITIRLGDAVDNIIVRVGSEATLIDSFEDTSKYEFVSYPQDVTGSIELSEESKVDKYSLSLKYDFSQGVNSRAAYVALNPETNGITLKGKPNKLGLWVKGDNNGSWLRAIAVDSQGNQKYLDFEKNIDWEDWKYIEANIPNNFSYPLKLQRIYVVETDSSKQHSGELLIDGLDAYYSLDVKNLNIPTATEIKDDLNKKSDISEGGYSFIVGHEPKNIDELVGYEASKSINNIMNQSRIGVSLNDYSQKFRSNIKNYSFINGSLAYRLNKHYDTLFISLKSNKNGLRDANADQWLKLNQDLINRKESNLVLFLPTPIFGSNGFTDKLEAELLHKKLIEAQGRGKNIFVVHGGNTTSTNLKDGIRYIELNTQELKSPEDIYNISLVKFYVNNDKISYEFVKVFK